MAGQEEFTVVLETTESFGPEVQVLQETAEDARTAASRALHDWHGREFVPTMNIEELEDNSVRVLAVLQGHTEALLARSPSGKLA
jgi:hypothetical protein